MAGKPPLDVNKRDFEDCVRECKAEGDYATQAELKEKITNLYNENHKVKISPSVVGLRCDKWNIDLGGGGKGRTEYPVDRPAFIAAINEVEKNGPLQNRSVLYPLVAEEYNKHIARGITHSIAQLRIRDWKIEVKTPMGQRGRPAGFTMSEEQKAAMLAGRRNRKCHPQKEQSIRAMNRMCPKRRSLIQRAANGSKVAQVQLVCLECCETLDEIRNCETMSCGLWGIRPYQNGNTEEDEIDEFESEETEEETETVTADTEGFF